MKIVVDADACPVKELIEKAAKKYQLEVIMISNHHHVIQSDYARVVVVDGASQSADIAITNITKSGDIVVTQDYGLASMVLGKRALAISPNGNIYDNQNIEGLLMQRFVNYKARKAGLRISGPRKRNPDDDRHFMLNLVMLIEKNIESENDHH
ncbi:MAG: YaiI/YqxD family protein [Syntrophomonas sp.]